MVNWPIPLGLCITVGDTQGGAHSGATEKQRGRGLSPNIFSRAHFMDVLPPPTGHYILNFLVIPQDAICRGPSLQHVTFVMRER